MSSSAPVFYAPYHHAELAQRDRIIEDREGAMCDMFFSHMDECAALRSQLDTTKAALDASITALDAVRHQLQEQAPFVDTGIKIALGVVFTRLYWMAKMTYGIFEYYRVRVEPDVSSKYLDASESEMLGRAGRSPSFQASLQAVYWTRDQVLSPATTMGPAPYNLLLSRRNHGAHTAHPLRVKKILEWHEQSISRGGEGYMSAAAYKLLQDGGFCLAFGLELSATEDEMDAVGPVCDGWNVWRRSSRGPDPDHPIPSWALQEAKEVAEAVKALRPPTASTSTQAPSSLRSASSSLCAPKPPHRSSSLLALQSGERASSSLGRRVDPRPLASRLSFSPQVATSQARTEHERVIEQARSESSSRPSSSAQTSANSTKREPKRRRTMRQRLKQTLHGFRRDGESGSGR